MLLMKLRDISQGRIITCGFHECRFFRSQTVGVALGLPLVL